MLSEALALHQNGQLDEARQRYEAVLAAQPEHPEALHLLGALNLQQGNAERAVELIEQAIALSPDNPVYYGNLANALHQTGEDETALQWLDTAVARFPGHAETHYNRGIVLASLKQAEAAVAAFREATRLAPKHAAAYYNLGNAHLHLAAFGEAADAYLMATQLRPKYVKAWYNLGKARREMSKDAAAVDAFSQAIVLDPAYAKAYYNRANALQSLKRHAEAVADYDRCIALQPNDDVALVNKGNALLSQHRFESAVDAYEQAISVKPDVAAYHNNKGNAYLGMRQTRRALDAYGRAIAVDPLEKDAHFNRAICHLLVGELEAGFEEYEWRWQTEDLAASAPNFEQPAWRGETSLAGKRLLLYCEQGLGDTIQFVRYARLASEQGAHVILVVQPPLLNLMRGLNGRGELIANGAPVPAFDYHCPLLSLPYAFKTGLATIPAGEPYIKADPALSAQWQKRLGQKSRPRVGLAWSGRPEHKNDENRSLRLEQLLNALPEGVEYICLQKELRERDRDTLAGRPDIRFFGDELRDFADTAALCEQLDLVVSVDTSVAHMAAALGKPTWVLLPFVPDWRWMLDRDDSPWYPSVKLFRQKQSGDWATLMPEVRSALQARFAPVAPRVSVPVNSAYALHCLYINLDAQQGRREALAANFARHAPKRWQLERIPAVDKRMLPENMAGGPLSDAAKACLLSHVAAVRRACELPGDVLILEDDAWFGANTGNIVSEIMPRLKDDVDLVFTDVCIPSPEQMLSLFQRYRKMLAEQRFSLLDLKKLAFAGTSAYIVRAQAKERLLALLSTPDALQLPYDLLLRQWIHDETLSGRVIFPFATSLSIHADTSNIQTDTSAATEWCWNAFRRVVWCDAGHPDAEDPLASMHAIPAEYYDSAALAMGKILATSLSANFVHK